MPHGRLHIFRLPGHRLSSAATLAALLFALLAAAGPAGAEENGFPLRRLYPDVPVISTAQLSADYSRTIVVDIRSKFEFDVAHVTRALLLPLSQEDFGAALEQIRPKRADTPLVFYCNGHDCAKSYQAARLAMRLGFAHVFAYDAGVFDWIDAAPKRSTLMGVSPANPDLLIPASEFEGHTLPFAEFKARGLAEHAVFIDIRDPFQRTEVPDLPGLHDIALDPLLELITDRVWTERPLYFVDAVGKQAQWLQYFLKAYGYFDYAFLKGGVESLTPEDLKPVQAHSGSLHVSQAALDRAAGDPRLHETDLRLLVLLLGRIQFDNSVALRDDELLRSRFGDRAALSGSLQRLREGNYLVFRPQEGNILIQINPNLAWKGDTSSDRWQAEDQAFRARAAARPVKESPK